MLTVQASVAESPVQPQLMDGHDTHPALRWSPRWLQTHKGQQEVRSWQNQNHLITNNRLHLCVWLGNRKITVGEPTADRRGNVLISINVQQHPWLPAFINKNVSFVLCASEENRRWMLSASCPVASLPVKGAGKTPFWLVMLPRGFPHPPCNQTQSLGELLLCVNLVRSDLHRTSQPKRTVRLKEGRQTENRNKLFTINRPESLRGWSLTALSEGTDRKLKCAFYMHKTH